MFRLKAVALNWISRNILTHLTTFGFLVHLLAYMLVMKTEVNTILKMGKAFEVVVTTCSRSPV